MRATLHEARRSIPTSFAQVRRCSRQLRIATGLPLSHKRITLCPYRVWIVSIYDPTNNVTNVSTIVAPWGIDEVCHIDDTPPVTVLCSL